jgi:hypothetical protein
MDCALMLRKLQGAVIAATGEGAKRASVRLEEGGKALQHAALVCFDEAMERSESHPPDTAAHASALLDMRGAADAMLYYNGGATMMQRYVSTRRPFIDADIVTGDSEAVDHVKSHVDAVTHVQQLIEDMLTFVKAEARLVPQIFSNEQTVMGMILERLCYQRLAPNMQGVMAKLAQLQQHHLDVLPPPSSISLASSRNFDVSDQILDSIVKIIECCWRFVVMLESDSHTSGTIVDIESRHEIIDIIYDILAPYVTDFLPQQVDVLTARVAVLLPAVTAQQLVQYDLHDDELAHDEPLALVAPPCTAIAARW